MLETAVVARRTEPAGLGPLLETCLDRIAGRPGAAAIWRVWEAAVGPHISRRAQPIRLRGQTLVVAVSSAPWMQELQLLKPAIRTQLNARLPEPMVSDLQLVLTEDGPEQRAGTSARPRPRCSMPPVQVDVIGLPPDLGGSFAAMLAAWQRRARREGGSS